MGLYIHWKGRVAALQLKPWFGLYWLNQFFGTKLMHCQMKLHMFTGRSMMGKIKTITAFTTDVNSCFNVQIGSELSFEGYLTNYGETSTQIFIQTLTNVP